MTSPPTDTELPGDEPSNWLDQHGNALFRYAYNKVRRVEVAEDLVQETLLAAWRKRDQFVGRSEVRTWLIAILKNKVIDWLRSSIREQNQVPLPNDSWLDEQFNILGKWRQPPAVWVRQVPVAECERQEFWDTMRACLDQLPTRLRQAFVLWQLEEQSGEDICQELGITSSNLWVMLHRSRHRLWQCLSANWCAEPETHALGGSS